MAAAGLLLRLWLGGSFLGGKNAFPHFQGSQGSRACAPSLRPTAGCGEGQLLNETLFVHGREQPDDPRREGLSSRGQTWKCSMGLLVIWEKGKQELFCLGKRGGAGETFASKN